MPDLINNNDIVRTIADRNRPDYYEPGRLNGLPITNQSLTQADLDQVQTKRASQENYANEKHGAVVLWNDLSDTAKERLTLNLRMNTSLYSVRSLSPEQVKAGLDHINPVLFGHVASRRWNSGWCGLHRWKEKHLSRLLYYLWVRRHCQESDLQRFKNLCNVNY